jgi:hypothetical protein
VRSFRKSVCLLLSLAATSLTLSAQNHPMPGAQSDPPVICTGCPGTNTEGELNAGKPTYPYDSPIKLHAGRIVDSASTATVQDFGMRTVRAGIVRTASGRIYLALGATVGAYTRATFFSGKLLQPMVAVNTISTGKTYGGRNPFEKLAKPDRFFYAEASSSVWARPLVDSNTVLNDFDVDDRGLLYIGTQNFGWGIVSDPGDATGTLLPTVTQVFPSDATQKLLSLRNGSAYYAYLSETASSTLFDVTTPASPVSGPERNGSSNAFTQWSKYESGSRVALRNADGHVRVYTYADLIAGNAPLIDVTPSVSRQFADLSFDDDGNLWIAESGTSTNVVSNVLWKLTPTPNSTYNTTTFAVYGQVDFSPSTIHASAGYIAVGGRVLDGAAKRNDLRLLRVTGGTPALLDTEDFFLKYYDRAPAGYAEPGIHASTLERVRIIAEGGKTYLFYNTLGLGDVYELGDEPRVTSMTPLSGIPAGGTNVSIYGTGFAAGTNVTFGGIAASSTFVSPTELTAVSPMHASGSVDVVVSPPAAASMTAPRQFTYLLATPSGLVATATSTTAVGISWTGVPGATFYEVSRRQPAGTWDVIGTPAITSFSDGARTAETTYVYRVRAGDTALNYSDYSGIDLATTMSSESSTITAGMPILSADLANVRMRVNAVRAAANLSATSFTEGGVGEVAYASHITTLRNALQQARLSLGYEPALFTDSIVSGSTLIKAVHLNELLDLMK